MPAVSGSITQLSSSVSTAASLEGLPDDAFKDGELAFVQTGRKTYQLDRTSTAAPNGTTVLDTFTGNGRWVIFGELQSSWGSQPDWYIDGVLGDDGNDGATPSTALKTWAEFARRVSTMSVDMTVTILSDLSEAIVGSFTSDGSDPGRILTIQGDPIVYLSGAEITNIAAPDPDPTVNEYGLLEAELSSVPVDWTTLGLVPQNFIEVIGSADPTRVGYATVIHRAPVATVAETPFWIVGSTVGAPAVGDTIRVFQARTVQAVQVSTTGVAVVVKYLNITNPTLTISSLSCDVAFYDVPATTLTLSGFQSCTLAGVYQFDGLATFRACFLLGPLFQITGSGVASYEACLLTGKLDLDPKIPTTFDGTIMVDGTLRVENGATADVRGEGLGVFESDTIGVWVTNGGLLCVRAPLYGKGNGTIGLQVSRGGRVIIDPTITVAANELSLTGFVELRLDPPDGIAPGTIIPIVAGVPTAPAVNLGTWNDWEGASVDRQAVNLGNLSAISGN